MDKLKRNIWPDKHAPSDFKCSGPVATKDGEFTGTRMSDFGCFKQDGKDTNKMYHACITQSTINQRWYVYVEWGRTGNETDCQFLECSSEHEAIHEYEKICHSKNDKRGEWYTHKVLGKQLRAKQGKDCYLVRPQSARNTKLTDGQNISNITKTVKIKSKLHREVQSLLSDLGIGVQSYGRSSFNSSFVPSPEAIEEARKILGEASKTKNIKELEELTAMLYSRIPKVKNKGDDYLLSNQNIKVWADDLDAFESVSVSTQEVISTNFELEYLEKNDSLYKFMKEWFESSTLNRHSYLGKAKVKHIWRINKESGIKQYQAKLGKTKTKDKPLHQISRIDLDNDSLSRYNDTNTAMLFHGTRSVNVLGILNSGLKLPKYLSNVAINGAMYGPGTYFADDWKKSAGYCSLRNSYWAAGGGKVSNRSAFIFITDVVMGVPYIPRGTCTSVPNGYNSIFAQGGRSGVANNEIIVFNENANQLRYLVEFDV